MKHNTEPSISINSINIKPALLAKKAANQAGLGAYRRVHRLSRRRDHSDVLPRTMGRRSASVADRTRLLMEGPADRPHALRRSPATMVGVARHSGETRCAIRMGSEKRPAVDRSVDDLAARIQDKTARTAEIHHAVLVFPVLPVRRHRTPVRADALRHVPGRYQLEEPRQ